jgi:small basic protein
MNRSASYANWLITIALFGGAALYCLVGAIRGRLFLPHRHSYGADVYLSGLAAWSVVTAVAMLWLGVSIRMGLLPQLSPKARTTIEMLLLVTGVALLFASGRLPTITQA